MKVAAMEDRAVRLWRQFLKIPLKAMVKSDANKNYLERKFTLNIASVRFSSFGVL